MTNLTNFNLKNSIYLRKNVILMRFVRIKFGGLMLLAISATIKTQLTFIQLQYALDIHQSPRVKT